MAEQNVVSLERGQCLIISAPHWFERADFLAWLRREENHVATWDRGHEDTEYADCFITFDGGGPRRSADPEDYEGSDFNGAGEGALPEDIEREIKRALFEKDLTGYGVVWIKPV